MTLERFWKSLSQLKARSPLAGHEGWQKLCRRVTSVAADPECAFVHIVLAVTAVASFRRHDFLSVLRRVAGIA